jgi:hypothetical protein
LSGLRRPLTLALLAAALLAVVPARAQQSAPEEEGDDLERLANAVADLIARAVEESNESIFEFFETVELWDAEHEIDRFVGSPWELNDSTAYKLSLLPFHIRYPIYRQIVRQMTRQDDLRSKRIHQVSPDSVKVIALGIGSLDEGALDYDERVNDQVRESLTTHFNARELIDLGFFLLAQQSAFPETEEGWRSLKHTLATGGPALAMGALVAGAAFDLGAFSRARPFFKRDYMVAGWYAGFRRLGFNFHPILRGGLTLRLPGLEMAAGLSEQIDPAETDRTRSVELAFREGLTRKLTRELGGWDVFFEAALREVVESGPLYLGEDRTGRAGLFIKRHQIPRLRHITIRASAELESDFIDQVRFGTSLGFEHDRSGVTTVFQASRAPLLVDGIELMDTRGGVFLTWTVEPLSESFVQALRGRARLVMDDWEEIVGLDRQRAAWEKRLSGVGTPRVSLDQAREAISGIERTMIAHDERMVRMAEDLADYLESRRRTYSMLRWARSSTGLYGPLDPTVLALAREQLCTRLDDVSEMLQKTPARLLKLRKMHGESLLRLRGNGAGAEDVRRELAALEALWNRESDHAGALFERYQQYRQFARRIVAASGRAEAKRCNPNPVTRGVIQKVLTLRTLAPR